MENDEVSVANTVVAIRNARMIALLKIRDINNILLQIILIHPNLAAFSLPIVGIVVVIGAPRVLDENLAFSIIPTPTDYERAMSSVIGGIPLVVSFTNASWSRRV